MKAIQYAKLGSEEVLSYVDVPTPNLGEGDVLIRVAYSALNHLDLHFRRGLPALPSRLPHIPGSDGAGWIEALGPHVTDLTEGDRVMIQPGMPCRSCRLCLKGHMHLCHRFHVVGREDDGTYAEFVRVPARQAHKVPQDMDLAQAAAFSLVYHTAWSMLKKAQLSSGDTVLIMSVGSGVGMAAVQLAKHLGLRVLGTVGSDEKLSLAQTRLGLEASDVITYTRLPIDAWAREKTQGQGVDAVIDHVGGPYWTALLRATRHGGAVVTCGATDGYAPTEDLRHIFYRQLRVLGSTLGTQAEYDDVKALFFAGHVRPIIDHTFPLAQARQAQRRLAGRQSFGKILLSVSR